MSEYRGYTGKSLSLLEKNNVKVGDTIKILGDLTFVGILMPRYESNDDEHIVIKLKSGYNVGIEINQIKNLEKLEASHQPKEETKEEIKTRENLPNVLLLSTGGTIASKVDYRTGGVTPALSTSDLLEAIPELAEIANIDAKILFSEYSENIVPKHWLEIAEKIKDSDPKKYAGIIIAHGTDTMHYTSSFLSFALAGYRLPIALVGSQRSSDRGSSDAALNLIGAVKFLIECKTNGVYVVMHQDTNDETIACHIGTRVRKNHTSKRGAFQTVGGDPAFLVVNNKVRRNMKGDFFTTKEFQPKIKLSEKVALVKYHPGYDPNMLKIMIDTGYKAIIFEGTGLGHIGEKTYPMIKLAHEKGIFMGMTSQCIDGRVSMTVYESGRDLLNLGIIPLEDMIPEVALVKAMWAAGNTENHEEIKEFMLKKIALEFST